MHLTHNSHLRWWMTTHTGHQPDFHPRSAVSDRFNFSIGTVNQSPSCWYQEFKNALEKLIAEHGTKLNVFYSGGFDSEILVRTLVELGVKPTVHTILFSGHENSDETMHTTPLCDELGIKQVIWIHDVHSYINSQSYVDLGVRYQCTQLAYLTVLEYVKQCTDAPCIMGGEIYLQKHQKPSLDINDNQYDWYYIYREDEDAMTYRYTQATGHPLVNEVFSYTPELMYAWINSPAVVAITSGTVPGKLSLLSSKRQIFSELYPHQTLATVKQHGYERLLMTNTRVRDHLREMVLPSTTIQLPVSHFKVP